MHILLTHYSYTICITKLHVYLLLLLINTLVTFVSSIFYFVTLTVVEIVTLRHNTEILQQVGI